MTIEDQLTEELAECREKYNLIAARSLAQAKEIRALREDNLGLKKELSMALNELRQLNPVL